MLSRRDILQVGSASLLVAEKRKDHRPRADSCIVIFLNSGPSHLDMWDMKLAAPADIIAIIYHSLVPGGEVIRELLA